jgi:hypothetical protein
MESPLGDRIWPDRHHGIEKSDTSNDSTTIDIIMTRRRRENMTEDFTEEISPHYSKYKVLSEKGQSLYEELRVRLERESFGKIVAIDVESQEYFLADSIVEAWRNGRRKYPGKDFYTVLIGGKVLFPAESLSLASHDVAEDHRWFVTYMKECIHFKGEYIAIANRSIVAHGKNAVRVAEEARKHTTLPLLFKVPEHDTLVV